MEYTMTKDEFLALRNEGLTFSQIGSIFGLTERQVNYRSKAWGLNYAKKKALNEEFFSLSTKATYYWAGFLAADGWIEGDRHRVGLALQKSDISHLEKFRAAVGSSHDICPFMNNTAYRIRFNSEKMCTDLATRFNVVPAKTTTYTMPYIEEDYLLLEFLRGYVEGDGNLWKTDSGKVILSLCSANPKFLSDFRDICELFLNKEITQQVVLNVNPKGSVYSIRFTVNDSAELVNLLYKNSTNATRLNRKFEVASLVLR